MTENKRFYLDENGINDREYEFSILGEDELVDIINELNDECEFLEIENESLEDGATRYAELYHKSLKENEQLKQQIKDLRLKVLDSLHDADDIQCSCNPCVVEECVKRVVE